MNVPTPPISYVIEAINNLPEDVVLDHASELCHMLSNLRDDHTELITNLEALLDKIDKHYNEVEELLDSFANERGRTVTEQLQLFANEVAEQKTQHLSLEVLIVSIAVHLTPTELSNMENNSVESREIHETVKAIMEKYNELMEEKE